MINLNHNTIMKMRKRDFLLFAATCLMICFTSFILSSCNDDEGSGPVPTITATAANADANGLIAEGEGNTVDFIITVTSGSELTSVTNGTDLIKSFTDGEKESTFTYTYTVAPGTKNFTFVVTDEKNRTALSSLFSVLGLANGPVTIPNGGFEQPVLADGGTQDNFGLIDGWDVATTYPANYSLVENPLAANENRVTEGSNYASLYLYELDADQGKGVTIFNTTNQVIFDNETYTLKYDLVNLYAAYEYTVSLYYVDGGGNKVELAKKEYVDMDLVDGHIDYSLTYPVLRADEEISVTISTAAAKGRKIGIQIEHRSPDPVVTDYSGGTLGFDNFRLEVQYN